MGDDAEAVIFEVSEAVSAALDEFHFPVEALGDTIVFGKAPHAGDGFGPRAQGIGQRDEGFKAAGCKLLDEGEELSGQRAAFPASAVLLIEEGSQAVHLIVEGFEGWIGCEEFLEADFLSRREALGTHAQDGQGAAMVLDVGSDLAGEVHEMLDDNTDDMEAVGNDPCIGEPFADQGAVRAGEVDADDSDALAAAEVFEEGDHIGGRSAFDDIEDLVVLEVAEGGGKALAFVEGVLVDAEDGGALEAQTFGSLAACELGVDAAHGGGSDALEAGHGGSGNALVVMEVNPFAERLGAMAAWKQSRQRRNKGASAIATAVTAGVDDEHARDSKGVEVPGTSSIPALVAEPYGSATRASQAAPI